MPQTLSNTSVDATDRPASRMARFAAFMVIGLATALGACSPYMLSGRVIEGEASYAMLVHSDDPRLQSAGLPGVSLRLTMDPGKLNRDVVADSVSGPEGDFALPVDRVGAGLLTMNMSILARKSGYASSEGFFELPGSGAAYLLVVIARGADTVGASDQPLGADEEVRRFWSE